MAGFSTGHSQNLVPNPSFETYTECPFGNNQGWPLECTPWQAGAQGTTDYFNECAVGTDVWIPDNLIGTQTAHTCDAYAGICFLVLREYREYL